MSKIITKIKIGQEERFLLQHLSINQPMNEHHTFELRCGLLEKPNVLTEWAKNSIGEDIEITLSGASITDQRKNFFRGIVTNVSLSKNLGGQNEIIFRAYSATIKLDDGPHQQSFTEQHLKDIAQKIATDHEVDIKIKGTQHSTPLPFSVQYQETSFNYLNRLANSYGEWLFFDGTDLHFGEAPRDEEIKLVLGRELFSFDLALNARPSNFKLLGYDSLNHDFPDAAAQKFSLSGLDDYGKLVADKSTKLFTHETVAITEQVIKNKADLDNFATYRKQINAAHYVLFDGNSDNHELRPGSIINVSAKLVGAKNTSSKASYGTFRIIHINHSLDGSGNYQNHFKAVSADLPSPPISKQVVIPQAEIQPAEVIDNKDPDELGRIKVQFQWQKVNNETTPWIRVAASGAGGTHGAYFVPEIGDQLLVGFEYNSPDRPYALGSLYHGKAKPSGVADPDNFKKVIKTRSGNQIYLSDEDGKEEIKIENGTNTIILSLDGSGSISITTAGDMSLSGKNITITAEEKLQIQCKNLDANADTEAKIGSDKVIVEAQTSAEINATQNAKLSGKTKTSVGEGSATSELKGGKVSVEGKSMTEIKGAMVKLN